LFFYISNNFYSATEDTPAEPCDDCAKMRSDNAPAAAEKILEKRSFHIQKRRFSPLPANHLRKFINS